MNERTCKDSVGSVTAVRTRALGLILTKGRLYRTKRCRHLSLVVFTKNVVEIDALKRAFGGNHYPHLVGWVWILGKREDLAEVGKALTPLEDGHRLEELTRIELRSSSPALS